MKRFIIPGPIHGGWRLAFGVLLLALGCESLAGIEDRRYEPGVTASPECVAYCDDVTSGCTGTFAGYPDRNTCLRICEELPRGEPALANTLECRAQEAADAVVIAEPASHCPGAGPFGASKCGTPCQAYCHLLETFCPEEHAAVADCADACQGLFESGEYDLGQLDSGDTLECRIRQLLRAPTDPSACEDAAYLPRTSSCSDPIEEEPSCDKYCQLVAAACTGARTVYESTEQCLDVCEALPPGDGDDTVENTRACRLYHSYSSLAGPEVHCPHSGPGGDGHCGLDNGGIPGNCESYCWLLAAACPSEFSSDFGNETTCRQSCAALAGAALDSGYAVATATSGDTLQCRLLHVSRAFSDASACAAAVGGSPCDSQ